MIPNSLLTARMQLQTPTLLLLLLNLKKQEEDKITKHLTSLTVNKAAEDTTMEFNELPAIESEASLKLLIRTLMDEDAKKEVKKWTKKKDK